MHTQVIDEIGEVRQPQRDQSGSQAMVDVGKCLYLLSYDFRLGLLGNEIESYCGKSPIMLVPLQDRAVFNVKVPLANLDLSACLQPGIFIYRIAHQGLPVRSGIL